MKNEMEKANQSQKIIDAAVKCIASRGNANISLRDIADEAGVALSQLNYYYGNKEGLLREVVKVTIRKYTLEIEETLNRGTSAKEKVAFLIQYFKGMLTNNPALFRLLYDFSGMAIWTPSFGELLRNLFDDLAERIDASLNVKVSRARMVVGAMFGIAIQAVLDPGRKDIPDALDAIGLLFE